MTTHFPECVDDFETKDRLTNNLENLPQIAESIDRIGCLKKVEWAINSFDPFKSHGTDQIIPKMLQVASQTISDRLVDIFRASLRFGYIPKP